MKNEEGKKTIWISEKLHQKLKMQSVIERKTIFSLVQEMYDNYKK